MTANTNPASSYGDIEGQDNEILKLREILKDEIHDYNRLSPAKGYLIIAFQWAAIFALMAFATTIGTWWSYLIAMPFIAGRQHALGALGHDGAHFRLSNNKTVNDWITDYLLMLPTFFSISRWRGEHIAHHRFIYTDKDPYLEDFKTYTPWHWPKTRSQALKTLLGDLFGLSLPSALEPSKRWGPFFNVKPRLTAQEKFRVFTFYPAVIILVTLTGQWLNLLLLWILPMLTFVIIFVRWRTIAEHLGMKGLGGIGNTRTVEKGVLQALFFAPCGINYHIDHHIFPGVPFYNLEKLHKRLLKEPVYTDNAIIKDGYFGRNSVFTDVVIT